jgi:hypothetical protein
MDITETYKVIRSQIEHIDNTISQRIVWLVIAQSFFFSGYAILVTGTAPDAFLSNKQQLLLVCFPVSAIIMTVISLVDIIAGMVYLNKLTSDYNVRKQDNDVPYPPIQGFKRLNIFKNVSAIIVPAAFLIIWVIIMAG